MNIPSPMNKKLIYILIAVVIIVAVGLWLRTSQPTSNTPTVGTPQENIVARNNTTEVINQDLNNIMVDEPDFKDIDDDLNSL